MDARAPLSIPLSEPTDDTHPDSDYWPLHNRALPWTEKQSLRTLWRAESPKHTNCIIGTSLERIGCQP